MSDQPCEIAVVSAFNPDNYGMYSVDLAGGQFFRELGVPVTHIVTQDRTRAGRLRFRLVRSARQLAAFRTIVYWGDFLNNPMWGERDYVPRELKRAWSATREAAWEQWCSLYLDIRAHAPGLRVLGIGGCFLGARDATLPGAEDRLRAFLGAAELLTPRDARSVEIIRSLVPDARVEPGMDCAWLLDQPPVARSTEPRHFVCFLGRSLRGRGREFLDRLGRQTGLKPVWLDWLNLDKPRFLADWRFRQMHRAIATAGFVVTDTYHLAINAMNRGVPAVCLHEGGQATQQGTLGDHKKVELMEQLGLKSLLVDVDKADDLAVRIRDSLAASTGPVFQAALARLTHRRNAYKALIRGVILAEAGNGPGVTATAAERP